MFSATAEHHLDEANTTTAKQIKEDLYVDNLITGTSNDEEALQLYKEAKKIFQDASMYQCIYVTGYPTQISQREHKSR